MAKRIGYQSSLAGLKEGPVYLRFEREALLQLVGWYMTHPNEREEFNRVVLDPLVLE